MNKNRAEQAFKAVNRLAKWRSVFAGWQLGTRPKGDPECDAVRDHREATLLLRAEVNALLELCLAKGLFTADEWNLALGTEADHLSKEYEKRFLGMTATDIGIQYDARAAETMKHWRP